MMCTVTDSAVPCLTVMMAAMWSACLYISCWCKRHRVTSETSPWLDKGQWWLSLLSYLFACFLFCCTYFLVFLSLFSLSFPPVFLPSLHSVHTLSLQSPLSFYVAICLFYIFSLFLLRSIVYLFLFCLFVFSFSVIFLNFSLFNFFLFYFLYPGILSFSCVRHTCTCARVPVHSRQTVCHAQHAPILLRTEPFELARLNLTSGAARNNRNFSS